MTGDPRRWEHRVCHGVLACCLVAQLLRWVGTVSPESHPDVLGLGPERVALRSVFADVIRLRRGHAASERDPIQRQVSLQGEVDRLRPTGRRQVTTEAEAPTSQGTLSIVVATREQGPSPLELPGAGPGPADGWVSGSEPPQLRDVCPCHVTGPGHVSPAAWEDEHALPVLPRSPLPG